MHDPITACIEPPLRLPSPVTPIHDDRLERKQVRLSIKRDDLIHPHLQGNKWRKLKYNLIAARQQGHDRLLTFGGAWSNHIHATAAAGHYLGLETIGVIRGEPAAGLTPTLQDAVAWGMQLDFVTRQAYRQRSDPAFIADLRKRFGDFYLVPEGGNNPAGIRGCSEIIAELEYDYDVICVDCGTGATMAGLIDAAPKRSRILGFAVLKNAGFLEHDIRAGLSAQPADRLPCWSLNLDYHFGGYARSTPALLDFIRSFHSQHGIQLEPVYSGKMFYGLYELIDNDYFEAGSNILAIHSGGLQGLRGFSL